MLQFPLDIGLGRAMRGLIGGGGTVRAFLAEVNARRCFPPVDTAGLALRRGEVGVLALPGTWQERRRRGYTAGGWTRWFGGHAMAMREYRAYDTLAVVATGRVVVTSRRVLFDGETRRAGVALRHLVAVQASATAVHLRTGGGARLILGVREPGLARAVIGFLMTHALVEGRLPEGVMVGAKEGRALPGPAKGRWPL